MLTPQHHFCWHLLRMQGVQFLDHFDSTLHFFQCERTLRSFAKVCDFGDHYGFGTVFTKKNPDTGGYQRSTTICLAQILVLCFLKPGLFLKIYSLGCSTAVWFFFWYAAAYITLLRDQHNWGVQAPEFRNDIWANNLYHFASKWSEFAKVLPTPFWGVTKRSMCPPLPHFRYQWF